MTREAAADAALARIENLAQAAAGEAPQSYSLGSDILDGWDAMVARLYSALARLAYLASVDTLVGDAAVCRTVVGWTGNSCSVWQIPPSGAAVSAHFESLNSALRFRWKLFLVLIASVRTATAICAAVASPVYAWNAAHSLASLISEVEGLV